MISLKSLSRINYSVETKALLALTSSTLNQKATLKATYGGKYPYDENPWPANKKYGNMAGFYDKTIPRLNENSKIVVVEGPPGVGKAKFAERLSKEFDLKYFGPTPDDDAFLDSCYGYDLRKFNNLLKGNAKMYDLADFYKDKHPETGRVGKLTLLWYRAKFDLYVKALRHLLATGQGAVMATSVFSDNIYVHAMHKMGWLTRPFVKYYENYRANSICELWRPHLQIYLDAPIDVYKKRLLQRNSKGEATSPQVNDKYLSTLESVFKTEYFKFARRYSEFVEVNWAEISNDSDMNALCEELQLIPLETDDLDGMKFTDWSRLQDDDYIKYRQFLDGEVFMEELFMRASPWDAPEVMTTTDEDDSIMRLHLDHPFYKYDPGWAPEFGHKVLFKIR